LATRGDIDLATRGEFFMATDMWAGLSATARLFESGA
jgi:hypothetical protein